MRVIGDNIEALDFSDFTVLPNFVCTNFMRHKFGYVPNLSLIVLIVAELLARQIIFFHYLKKHKKQQQLVV